MLEILLLIWIGRTFSKFAKSNNLSSALWTTLGVLSYIVGQVIGIVILLAVDPYFDNVFLVYAYGLPMAAIATIGTYQIMKAQAKNSMSEVDSEILDENI